MKELETKLFNVLERIEILKREKEINNFNIYDNISLKLETEKKEILSQIKKMEG